MPRQVQVLRRERSEQGPELGPALRRPGQDDDLGPGGEVRADDPLADGPGAPGDEDAAVGERGGKRGQDVSSMMWTSQDSLVQTT